MTEPPNVERAAALARQQGDVARLNALTCRKLAAQCTTRPIPYAEREEGYLAEAKEHEDAAATWDWIASRLPDLVRISAAQASGDTNG